MTTEAPEPFATATMAQPSPGLPAGEGHFYSDGFRPGDFKYSYGVLEQLLQQNPGWLLADGTVTLQDGTTPPDLRDRFLIGAGTTYTLGDTGGSSELTQHTHEFTQPEDHEVTQPDDHTVTQPDGHADHALTNNHVGTNVLSHSGHAFNVQEFTATGLAASAGSGRWAITGLGGGTTSHNMTHDNNHTVIQPTAHQSPLTHDNNHEGTEVDAHAGTDVSPHAGGEVGEITDGPLEQLPPYAALYLLVKVY